MNQLLIFLNVLNVRNRGVKVKYILHKKFEQNILLKPSYFYVKEQFHELFRIYFNVIYIIIKKSSKLLKQILTLVRMKF